MKQSWGKWRDQEQLSPENRIKCEFMSLDRPLVSRICCNLKAEEQLAWHH